MLRPMREQILDLSNLFAAVFGEGVYCWCSCKVIMYLCSYWFIELFVIKLLLECWWIGNVNVSVPTEIIYIFFPLLLVRRSSSATLPSIRRSVLSPSSSPPVDLVHLHTSVPGPAYRQLYLLINFFCHQSKQEMQGQTEISPFDELYIFL